MASREHPVCLEISRVFRGSMSAAKVQAEFAEHISSLEEHLGYFFCARDILRETGEYAMNDLAMSRGRSFGVFAILDYGREGVGSAYIALGKDAKKAIRWLT